MAKVIYQKKKELKFEFNVPWDLAAFKCHHDHSGCETKPLCEIVFYISTFVWSSILYWDSKAQDVSEKTWESNWERETFCQCKTAEIRKIERIPMFHFGIGLVPLSQMPASQNK